MFDQQPDLDRKPLAEIEKTQNELLRKQLAYVNTHSPFYREHFKQHPIDVKNITSVHDLVHIPTVDKHDLQRHNRSFWCVEPLQIVDYCNTSGTEGHPVTIPLTRNDLARLAYNEKLSFLTTGGSPYDIYQLTTTIDRRFMAGLAYMSGAHLLGAGFVRVGPGLPELQWQTIQEISPTVLIVVPSFLVKLIDYARSNNIDYLNSGVKKVICIGEPVRQSDFDLNALGRRINQDWDLPLHSTYASSEMATAFTECAYGCGGHLQPGLIIAEILDENDQPVSHGSVGELTVTTLGVEGMPLVRFRTGDMCAMHAEPCACGRNTPRLGPIVGRKHQMIKYKGTTCYPPAIFEALDSMPHITQYQVIVDSDNLQNDRITVLYATTSNPAQDGIKKQLKAKLRFVPDIVAMTPEQLHDKIHDPSRRKPVKFLDNRRINQSYIA